MTTMANSTDNFFERVKGFFVDRRASHAGTPPDGITCRRGKNQAQFGQNKDWYLTTSIVVEEVDVDIAELKAKTAQKDNPPT